MEQPEGPDKQPMTIRLSAEARRLLTVLSRREATSKTGIIERAIRQYAKQEGVS